MESKCSDETFSVHRMNLNLCILHMIEDAISLDMAHISSFQPMHEKMNLTTFAASENFIRVTDACSVNNVCLYSPSNLSHLTHLCLVDSSTTTLWTRLFPIAGCQFSFYYYYVL